MQIPPNYQTVMPYLILENAEDFFVFTQSVFGAAEQMRSLDDNGRLMHCEVNIGGSTIMFANTTDVFSVQTAGLYINVANADETYNKALQAGATSIMEPSNQSYGRSGGIKDAFGNTWWLVSALN
ncbi:VOC family protein [Mucilaginibacter hurinus]|uniref:VOC family protein n=1 Tax=Mucilaginibacter hurinus TaxID=2201324 RepID=A0A367GQN9_9SPHI|nr:VOC family protein [Mucilaginibacter hurinus]